jgi:hypothetical protein
MVINITDNQILKTPNNYYMKVSQMITITHTLVYVEGLLRVYHKNIRGLKGKVN